MALYVLKADEKTWWMMLIWWEIRTEIRKASERLVQECDIQRDGSVSWPLQTGQAPLESHIYTAAKQMVESARQDTSHTFLQRKGEWWRQHVVLPPALECCIIKARLQKKKKKKVGREKKKDSHSSRWLTFLASLAEATHQEVPKHLRRVPPFLTLIFAHTIFSISATNLSSCHEHTLQKLVKKKSEDALLCFVFLVWKNVQRESDAHGTITGWDIDFFACYCLTYAHLKLAVIHNITHNTHTRTPFSVFTLQPKRGAVTEALNGYLLHLLFNHHSEAPLWA